MTMENPMLNIYTYIYNLSNHNIDMGSYIMLVVFHSHAGTPKIGKFQNKMEENWGYPYFSKLIHVSNLYCWFLFIPSWAVFKTYVG